LDHTHTFITGCTNSGTGFLRFFVHKHPELSVLMKEGQHYCKHLPHDAKLGLKRRLFALYPDVYRWTKDDLEEHKSRKVKKSFYKHWDLSKKFLVEKSPHHMMRMEFMNETFPHAKFIGIVRNGYVVAEGINRRREHKLKLCAKQWNACNKIMMEDSSKVDFLLVTYEDLCKKPQKVMDKVFKFIGVKPIEINLDWTIPRANMFGLDKYFTLKNSPDFNHESFDRLLDKDLEKIEKYAGEMLEYFGYLEERDESIS